MITTNELNELLLDESKLQSVVAKRKRTRSSKRPDFETLFQEYVLDGQSSSVLAKKYDVTPVTVRRWFAEMKQERLKQLLLKQQEQQGVTA